MRKNEERKLQTRSKSSILLERPKKQQLRDNWLLDSMIEKGGNSLYHSMIIPSDNEKHMEQILKYDGYIDFEAQLAIEEERLQTQALETLASNYMR